MKKYFNYFYVFVSKCIYRLVYFLMAYTPVFQLYQPIYGQQNSKNSTRQCEDRWKVFSKHLPSQKGSILDIGCNIGYFSFQLAEQGHFVYGLEADDLYALACKAIKDRNKINNVVFIKQYIDHDFAKNLPSYDVIVNLSVFHHWVKVYGLEQATDMMRLMANKCSCMVFETGQSNEIGSQWPEILAFMGDDPQEWIAAFLKDIGFTDVVMAGTFETGLTNVDRYLFVAKK